MEVPDEIELRLHLRNEMFSSGFREIIKVSTSCANFSQELRKWAAQEFREIICHVDAFEVCADRDFEQFTRDLDLSFEIDLFDHQSLIRALYEILSLKGDTISSSHITTILQQLLIPAKIFDCYAR